MAPRASLQTFRARLPGPRTLLSVAGQAVERYQALWQTAFQDSQAGLNTRTLQQAIRSPVLLETEQQVMQAWAQFVEQPLRQRLPLALEETIGQVMTAADLPQPTRALLRLPQVQQAIQETVGAEIVSVSRTTLRGVRQVLREGWQTGASPQTLAYRLKREIGLTPRQQTAIATLKARLQGQGQTARQIAPLLRAARARALQQRALLIARTETTTAANLGAYQALQALAQSGQIAAVSTLRRFWITTGRACAICTAIPGMNAGGVPLEQPFQTPAGPRFYPAAHPNCSCVTSVRYIQEG